ncbi:putative toxin-antitoxin system toxin component, PIN family, partial [Candidatus Gottesmanbacteria bacterium RIFCSPLOWO2_02_FULL_38_8]
MAVERLRVLLDTNILISAIGFGGKPRKILQHVLKKKIIGVTSSILLAELEDVLNKKFTLLSPHFERINKLIRKRFYLVKPTEEIRILKDDDDNRVLEAAKKASCSFIVTGDKELLDLKNFKNIK